MKGHSSHIYFFYCRSWFQSCCAILSTEFLIIFHCEPVVRRDEPESMAVAKWRWDWQLDRLGFGTADETVNTPAGAAADEAVAVAVAEAWVFGNICCCQHISSSLPLPLPLIYWRQFRCRYCCCCCYSTTILMTVVMEPVDLAGFLGTSPCWKLRWISLLLTVECVHNSCRAA